MPSPAAITIPLAVPVTPLATISVAAPVAAAVAAPVATPVVAPVAASVTLALPAPLISSALRSASMVHWVEAAYLWADPALQAGSDIPSDTCCPGFRQLLVDVQLAVDEGVFGDVCPLGEGRQFSLEDARVSSYSGT